MSVSACWLMPTDRPSSIQKCTPISPVRSTRENATRAKRPATSRTRTPAIVRSNAAGRRRATVATPGRVAALLGDGWQVDRTCQLSPRATSRKRRSGTASGGAPGIGRGRPPARNTVPGARGFRPTPPIGRSRRHASAGTWKGPVAIEPQRRTVSAPPVSCTASVRSSIRRASLRTARASWRRSSMRVAMTGLRMASAASVAIAGRRRPVFSSSPSPAPPATHASATGAMR